MMNASPVHIVREVTSPAVVFNCRPQSDTSTLKCQILTIIGVLYDIS